MLTGTKHRVRGMTLVPEKNLVVATSGYHHVHVYDMDTTGAPRIVFKHHTNEVMDVVQLEDDIVASVGEDAMLLSWRAASGELVDMWQNRERRGKLRSVMKMGNDRIVVGDCFGSIICLEHKSGSTFEELHRSSEERFQNTVLTDLVLYHALPSNDRSIVTPNLWDDTSLSPLTTLPHDELVFSAAVSDQLIVLVIRWTS